LQFNTAGGSEFQVRGAAVLNDRLANDVRRKTHTAVGRTTILYYNDVVMFLCPAGLISTEQTTK